MRLNWEIGRKGAKLDRGEWREEAEEDIHHMGGGC